MNTRPQVKFSSAGSNEFFVVLRKRVDEYFKTNNLSKHANGEMILKTILLLLAYIAPFVVLLYLPLPFWGELICWSVMGVAVAGIGMSIMHDANHGAYSSNKTVNYLMGHTLNLVGGSVYNWKLQHNLLHHTYTNISGLDDDIQDRAALKLSPHSEVKGMHRFQDLYAVFFYGLMTLYWVFLKDLIQFIKYTKDGTAKVSAGEKIRISFLIVSNKVFYLFIMLAVPTLFFGIPFWQVGVGFIVMHFLAGLILALVFQLAHTVEGTTHPLPDEDGMIQNAWAIHQMETTVDFSPKNKWLSWYVGGLNYQVEHHLFPNICHVHYPAIAPIVKATAEEYNVPYNSNPTFSSALKSHFRILHQYGLPEINEVLAG